MTDKIALEEHFMAPGFEDYFARTAINISPALFGRAAEALADFGERRLSAMDSIGVRTAVLSLSGPGVQAEFIGATAGAGGGGAWCRTHQGDQLLHRQVL